MRGMRAAAGKGICSLAMLALVICLFTAPAAHAQGTRKDDIVLNSRGLPLAGATVRVCTAAGAGQPCAPLAAIYSDAALTQALANPTTTDGMGNYTFYAAPGKYMIEISGPSITTRQMPNVLLPSDPTAPSFSGAISAFSLSLGGNLSVGGSATVTGASNLNGGGALSGTFSGNPTFSGTPSFSGGLTLPASSNGALKPATADAVRYVSNTGNDTNDGLSWGTAKLTEAAACASIAGGNSSCTAGTGTIFMAPSFSGALLKPWSGIDVYGPAGFSVASPKFKGPNPYVDVTTYGVRVVTYNAAPAIPGITASINSASTTATLSSASTFQNGDGVVIFGAGAAHAMATPGAPTVTPSVASAGTGTGLVVNGPAGGATTYNYQIIARDKAQGLTATSTVGTTASGAAAIGVQTVTITSISKSGQTNTVVTSAAHGLSVGSMVNVQGTSVPADFDGWFVVATVADNTHFTYQNGMDSNSGSQTAATGGTARWWNCNHLTWTAVTGAFEYYIYGRTGGSLTLLGVSKPNGGTYVDLSWDDFGSPMMDNFSAPYFVPTTPPGAATSDSLVTTISSGAGTTTLTLAAAAGTTVAGATILFDNAPNILTAANASRAGNGTLYFPISAAVSNPAYAVNSYLILPTMTAISQVGIIFLNDTIEVSGLSRWFGNLTPQGGNVPSFGFEPGAGITVNRASPGLYSPNLGSSAFRGLSFGCGVVNNCTSVIFDYPFGVTLDSMNFAGAGSASEYMAMYLNFRGDVANTAYSNSIRNIALIPASVTPGSTMTPAFYCNGCDQTTIDRVNLNSRGLFFRLINNANLSVQTSRFQGGIIPFLTVYSAVNAASLGATVKDIQLDTMPHATVANLFSQSSNITLTMTNAGSPASSGFGYPSNTTGKPISRLVGMGTSGQNIQAAYLDSSIFSDNSVQISGTNGAVGYALVSSTAPSAVVSAGGSAGIATYTFKVTWLDVMGKETLVSLPSSPVTTTGGNQTITVTPPSAPPGAVGWLVYFSTGGAYLRFPCGALTPGVAYVINGQASCNNSTPLLNLALTAGFYSGGLFGQQLALTGGGFKNTISGTFTAARTQTLQDAADTFVYRNTTDTLTNKTLTSPALTTPVIGSGTTLTVYRRIAATLSPAAVGANTCAAQSFTVTGLAAGDILIAVNKPTEQAGLSALPGHVTAANTATVNFCNHTAGSITPTASESYNFVAVQ